MSGSGPMSAVRVVLFGHEIVHKVVHFAVRAVRACLVRADFTRNRRCTPAASTAYVLFTAAAHEGRLSRERRDDGMMIIFITIYLCIHKYTYIYIIYKKKKYIF